MRTIIFIVLFSFSLFAKDKNFFIENKGQVNADILYYANLDDMNFFIKEDGIYFDFYTIDNEVANKPIINGEVVKFHFHSSNKFNHIESKNTAKVNYFIGNDSQKWIRNTSASEEILIKNIYNNIDLRFYFDNSTPRYDFIINKGANVSDIKFSITGFELTELGKDYFRGNLALGTYSNDGLKAIQKNNIIESNFEYSEEGYFTINVGEYNKNETLIIDPIIYTSYLGWNGKEKVTAIQNIDALSYIIAGTTESKDFPVTEGVYQDYYETGTNIFIAEYKRNGLNHEFVRGTYFGGSAEDIVNTMVIDNNNIYFGGYTTSNNFPYMGPIDQTYAAKKDGFIAALSLDMTELKYSYHVGAENDDEITDIKVKNGELYFCGNTSSLEIPTVKPIQSAMRGVQDGIIGKNNSAGSALEYLTYIGGSGEDRLSAIDITNLDDVCWIGSTKSIDLQTFPDQINDKKAPGDNFDIMMGIFRDELTEVILTTYLGGTEDDFGSDLKYIAGTEFYFVGYSYKESANTLPISDNVYQDVNKGQADILFGLRKISELSKLTYIGGDRTDIPHKLDRFMPNGDFVIVGETDSRDFPIITEEFETTQHSGKKDGLIIFASEDFTKITYSAYVGGREDDQILDFDVIAEDNIRFTGKTLSKDFTLYGKSLQNTNTSGNASFIGETNDGTIQMQSPLGGFDYCPLVTIPILFTPKNLDDDNIVDIYLVNDELDTKELIIDNYNDVRYDWTIPETVTANDKYKVLIEHKSGVFIESPQYFIINPIPKIDLFETSNKELSYCEGDSLVLNVEFSQASDPVITWQKDGKTIVKNNLNSLTIKDLSTEDSGIYTVLVDGECPPTAISQDLQITVNPTTEITSISEDQTLNVGDNLKLFVNVIGTNLEYQWKFKGNDIAGKVDSILTIDNIQTIDAGAYSCDVSGLCGETISSDEINVEVNISSVTNSKYFKSINYSNNNLDINLEIIQAGEYTLQLIDLLGNEIYSNKLNLVSGQNIIRENIQLNNGFYIINISNNSQNISYKLIVRN